MAEGRWGSDIFDRKPGVTWDNRWGVRGLIAGFILAVLCMAFTGNGWAGFAGFIVPTIGGSWFAVHLRNREASKQRGVGKP